MGQQDNVSGDSILYLRDIDKRHPGITEHVAGALCEAAAVCLSKHHKTPAKLTVRCLEKESAFRLLWDEPDQRIINAHAYINDASKDGAYAVSLICVENMLSYFAIGQAEAGTGSDWYIAPYGCGLDEFGQPNLDDPAVRRLEVSGQIAGNVSHRVKIKLEQLLSGVSDIPGIAAVVGFGSPIVVIREAVVEGAPNESV